MAARLRSATRWIAIFLPMPLGAVAITASVVALVLFALLIHSLVFKLGIANWASLGVGMLFVAIIGALWLVGNSLLDAMKNFGSPARRHAGNSRTKITLPWLSVAAVVGLLVLVFGK